MEFEEDIEACLKVLRKGGLILYPTDTIWGIGCDAANQEAVRRIYSLKLREESKSMIILLADPRDLLQYLAAPDPDIFDYIETLDRPTTIIYDHAIGLADNLIARDGSIGIRLVKDDFCRHLLKRFRKPIVSTSANLSGEPAPRSFREISPAVRKGVDYIVKYRQMDERQATPSRVVRWEGGGKARIIRE